MAKDDLSTVIAKVYTHCSFSVFTGEREFCSESTVFLYVSNYVRNTVFYQLEQRFFPFAVMLWAYTLNPLYLLDIQSVSVLF